MNELIQRLRAELPAIWEGRETDRLTGYALRWSTLKNRRSRREIPDDCFVRQGQRVLVIRDPFLDWWGSQLSDVRATAAAHDPGGPRPLDGRRDRSERGTTVKKTSRDAASVEI